MSRAIETLERRCYLTLAVTGSVYLDTNQNGIKDSNESAYAGATVFVDLNRNDVQDTGEPSAISTSDGSFLIASNLLAPGSYPVFATAISKVYVGPGNLQNKVVTTGPDGAGDVGAMGLIAASSVSAILYAAETGKNGDGNARYEPGPGDAPANGAVLYIDTNQNGSLDAGEGYTNEAEKSGAWVYYYKPGASATSPERPWAPDAGRAVHRGSP